MNNTATISNIALSSFDEMRGQPIWDSWSNQLFPETLEKALHWGNWLRTHNGDLVAAVQRGVCYFLNGVELSGKDDDLDSKDHYTSLLEDEHHIMEQILTVGMNLLFYGNSFTTIMRATTRILKCPKCGQIRYLRNLTRGTDYDFKKGKFHSTCPCGYRGIFDTKDYVDNNNKHPLKCVHWNPLSISLDSCSITGEENVTFNPAKEDRSFIENEAASAALETLPQVFLDAIADDKSVLFDPNGCLHLALPSDAMNANTLGGWGVPAFIPSFKYVVMMMLLERQTEAAVKDYILPIRLLFPDPTVSKGGSDPMGMATNVMHMGQFRNQVEEALRSQAFQQSSWHLIPSAVQQLSLGGDGKAIVPVDVLQFAKEQLLDSLCIPVEFYKNSILSGNAPPNSLRMFEQTWERRVILLDNFVNYYLSQCRQLLQWPTFTGALMRQSLTTDPNRMNFMFQLAAEGKISQTTLLRGLNINPKAERYRIMEDAINDAKLQTDIQNRMQAAGMLNDVSAQQLNQDMQNAMAAGAGGDQAMAQGPAGAPPAQGGAMPPPAPGMTTGDPMTDIQNLQTVRAPQNASPDQLQADAQTVASILMSTPIGAQRNQIYSLVKQLNPTLYDISKSVLQKIENQAKQQGLEQARQGGM